MTYDLFEHRHRFAIWAAARAAQRGFASVAVLRGALEATDIVQFARDPESLVTDQTAFEAHHRVWCRDVIRRLKQKGIANVTFGRAAKLVAIYLKAMIVIGPHEATSLASVAHPPIDRILLRGLAASAIDYPQKAKWRGATWTTLDEKTYYDLVADLRNILAKGEPFWRLEQYWTVEDD